MNNYFNNLNYTLGNEDTALEFNILPNKIKNLFTIAGSGSRVVPLFAKNPDSITCVDISAQQLYLTELRINTVKELDLENYMSFWGYPGEKITNQERKTIFNNLEISKPAKDYLTSLFEKIQWEAPLYRGRWEKTIKKISFFNKLLMGKKIEKMFECNTIEQQKKYFKNIFPYKTWRFSIALMGNSVLFNYLLYKGNFPKKNINKNYIEYYQQAFNKLFKQSISKDNYFLQLFFLGEINYTQGLPLECDPIIFYKSKKGIKKAKIFYKNGNFIEKINECSNKIDFLSLSDVISYLSPNNANNFLQRINQNLNVGCLIVNRYYLYKPTDLNLKNFNVVTENYTKFIEKEKTQMYEFEIYQRQ